MATSPSNLPANWNTNEMLDGLDILDKGEIIGVPFRITGAQFRTNDKAVQYVAIDAEDVNGDTFTFQDSSSTGVKAQVIAYLTTKGADHIVDTGEYVEFSIVVPRGLRVSEWDREIGQGRTQKARTYYLTTSGRRQAQGASPAQASRTRKTRNDG